MSSQADPFVRLQALKSYMDKWIDSWPKPYPKTFAQFFRDNYRKHIPGTPEYIREHSTHCFYCEEKMYKGVSHPKRHSVDHYRPKALGVTTDRYVICCAECNTRKGHEDPELLVAKIRDTVGRGVKMWGYRSKKMLLIAKNIESINNDILFNTGPKTYHIVKIKVNVK
jgi:hypothetical protein